MQSSNQCARHSHCIFFSDEDKPEQRIPHKRAVIQVFVSAT